MKCPKCSTHNIRVLESRSAEAGQSVRRRRECMECKFRFTTYERIEFVPIIVIKRDGVSRILRSHQDLEGGDACL